MFIRLLLPGSIQLKYLLSVDEGVGAQNEWGMRQCFCTTANNNCKVFEWAPSHIVDGKFSGRVYWIMFRVILLSILMVILGEKKFGMQNDVWLWIEVGWPHGIFTIASTLPPRRFLLWPSSHLHSTPQLLKQSQVPPIISVWLDASMHFSNIKSFIMQFSASSSLRAFIKSLHSALSLNTTAISSLTALQ